MLRELLKEKNMSVYALSRRAALPYTTVNELVLGKKQISSCSVRTVAALAEGLDMSMDEFYALACGTRTEQGKIADTWERAKEKAYRFPLIVPGKGYDASRIHPLKQRAIYDIVSALREEKRIAGLTLFGSAATICCGRKSDVDLAVELKAGFGSREDRNEISECIQNACNYDADILWMDRIRPGSKIDGNIRRGVKLI